MLPWPSLRRATAQHMQLDNSMREVSSISKSSASSTAETKLVWLVPLAIQYFSQIRCAYEKCCYLLFDLSATTHVPFSTSTNANGYNISVVLMSPLVLPALCPLVPIMYSREPSLIAPKPLLSVMWMISKSSPYPRSRGRMLVVRRMLDWSVVVSMANIVLVT